MLDEREPGTRLLGYARRLDDRVGASFRRMNEVIGRGVFLMQRGAPEMKKLVSEPALVRRLRPRDLYGVG